MPRTRRKKGKKDKKGMKEARITGSVDILKVVGHLVLGWQTRLQFFSPPGAGAGQGSPLGVPGRLYIVEKPVVVGQYVNSLVRADRVAVTLGDHFVCFRIKFIEDQVNIQKTG